MTLRGFQPAISLMELSAALQWMRNPELLVDSGSVSKVCSVLAACVDDVAAQVQEDIVSRDFFQNIAPQKSVVLDSLEETSALLKTQDSGRQWCGLRSFFRHFARETTLNEKLYEYIVPDTDLMGAFAMRVGVKAIMDRAGGSVGSLFDLHPSAYCVGDDSGQFTSDVLAKVKSLANLQEFGIVTGLAQYFRRSGSYVYAQSMFQWAALSHEYRRIVDPSIPQDILWDSAREYACFLEGFGKFHEAGLVRSYVESERRHGDLTQDSKMRFLKGVKSRLRNIERTWCHEVQKTRFARREMGSLMSRLYAETMKVEDFWKYILGDPSIGEYFSGFINQKITQGDVLADIDVAIEKVPVTEKVSEELFLVIDLLKKYVVNVSLDKARYEAYGVFSSATADGLAWQVSHIETLLNDLNTGPLDSHERFCALTRIGGLIDALLVFLHEKCYANRLRVDLRRQLQDDFIKLKKRWARMFEENVGRINYSFWISEMLKLNPHKMPHLNHVNIDEAQREIRVKIERAQEVDLALRLKIFAAQNDTLSVDGTRAA